MKQHKIKPRNLFLLISILILFAAFAVYTVAAGSTYTFTELTGEAPLKPGEIYIESSDENVIQIASVEQDSAEPFNLLYVTVKSAGTGDCKLTLKYPAAENDDTVTRTVLFRVLPFGVIFDLTMDSFTGLNAAFPLAALAQLLVIIVLSLSFREKQKNGDFSYSMVVTGGMILFFLFLFFLLGLFSLVYNPLWSYEAVNIKDILSLIVSSGNRFVMFSEIPVLLLSAALAVSNIWLVVKEGFRPQNLLGIVIAVLIAGGMVTIRLSNNYYTIESDALYYFTMLMNISTSFLLTYFECMFLSTMLCAIASTRYKPPYEMDYIIILGCAIRKDGTPTPILRGRVQRAFDFAQKQEQTAGKQAIFVPSGGQGSDEVISEAESMKRCLMEMGVPESRILKEDKSVNTYQNMAFSKRVIEQHAGDLNNVNIAFSTTNYHVFRGYTLAEKLRMKVKGLSAKTKLYFFPNAFVREFIGLLWEKKWKHLLFIVIFFTLLLLLYFIIMN